MATLKKGTCVGILYYRHPGFADWQVGVHNGRLLTDFNEATSPRLRINHKPEKLTFNANRDKDRNKKGAFGVAIKVFRNPVGTCFWWISSKGGKTTTHNGSFERFVSKDGKVVFTDINKFIDWAKKPQNITTLFNGTVFFTHWNLVSVGAGRFKMTLQKNQKAKNVISTGKL
ncbi:hypothetical protein [Hazenella coriacea]|uniref:Uncharacterized protein n=1 Tax=Hazenella coriacea TaxID=1179467 RepID=A0A4R3LC25_9BACL|nr:hypothetical protein [Hazenella coriacea]TCS96800.1 hypothetical protein EDD58_101442 [Hazenella coriacea]